MTFGASIRARRKELGLTLADIAGRIGCSDSLIANLESGAKQPTAERIAQFAEVLDLDADALAFEAGHLPPALAAFIAKAPRARLALLRAIDVGENEFRTLMAAAGDGIAPETVRRALATLRALDGTGFPST